MDETDGVWEILKRFDEKQAISFFKDAGVYPRERDGYVYPMSLQAVSLRNCLQRKIDKKWVHLEEEVLEITQNMSELGKCTGFVVKTDKDRYLAKKVIITGRGYGFKMPWE